MIDDWCPNAACHRLALHSMCAAVPCGWGERLLEICVRTINNQRAPGASLVVEWLLVFERLKVFERCGYITLHTLKFCPFHRTFPE